MSIWERISATLAPLGVPMAAIQYMAPSPARLPDLFLVYTLITSVPAQHADDQETARTYPVQVSIYSRAGLANLPDVDSAMLAAGFQRGPSRPVPYSEESRHFGLANDYVFLEEIP